MDELYANMEIWKIKWEWEWVWVRVWVFRQVEWIRSAWLGWQVVQLRAG